MHKILALLSNGLLCAAFALDDESINEDKECEDACAADGDSNDLFVDFIREGLLSCRLLIVLHSYDGDVACVDEESLR